MHKWSQNTPIMWMCYETTTCQMLYSDWLFEKLVHKSYHVRLDRECVGLGMDVPYVYSIIHRHFYLIVTHSGVGVCNMGHMNM